MNRAAPLTLPCSPPSWHSAHTLRKGETSPSPQLTQVNTYQESPLIHTSIHTCTYVRTHTHTSVWLRASSVLSRMRAFHWFMASLLSACKQTVLGAGQRVGQGAGQGRGWRWQASTSPTEHTLHVCHCLHVCPSLVRHDK